MRKHGKPRWWLHVRWAIATEHIPKCTRRRGPARRCATEIRSQQLARHDMTILAYSKTSISLNHAASMHPCDLFQGGQIHRWGLWIDLTRFGSNIAHEAGDIIRQGCHGQVRVQNNTNLIETCWRELKPTSGAAHPRSFLPCYSFPSTSHS
jgi:hypothetical protein